MEKDKFLDSKIKNELDIIIQDCTKTKLALWAADCAEHVMTNYNINVANDCIKAAREWARGQCKMILARAKAIAAHRVARDTPFLPLRYALRACGHAAATAHMAGHAIHASTYAAKSVFYLNQCSLDSVEKERKWQYLCLIEHVSKPN